jgi:hypothetical protein
MVVKPVEGWWFPCRCPDCLKFAVRRVPSGGRGGPLGLRLRCANCKAEMRIRTGAVIAFLVLVVGFIAMWVASGVGVGIRFGRYVVFVAIIVVFGYASSHGVLVRRGKRYKRPKHLR